MNKRLDKSRSYLRIGLISSIVVGILLMGYSLREALLNPADKQIPLGPLAAVLMCMAVFSFLKLYATLYNYTSRLRDRSVLDAGKWAFEYPYLRRRLREEQAKLDREGGHSSLLLIEVPALGRIGERAGWRKQERVAQQLSNWMCTTFRGSDVTGRISEGMFLTLLPNASPQQAKAAALRLWKTAGCFDFGKKRQSEVCPRLLVGIAGYPDNGENIDCTLAAAQEALETAWDEQTDSIAVSKQTFRSAERECSLLRQVRAEGVPRSVGHARWN